jgi:DNA-binding NarL/FixJ family response regulator
MVERHDEHDTLLAEIRALAGRTGNSVAAVAATIYHGMELDRRGRPDGAEAEAALAMSFSSGGGWPAGSPELTCVQATALLGRGDIDGAQAVLVQAPFDVAAPDSVPTALLLDTRGQVALARGDTDTAIADCTAAGSCVDKLEVSNPALVAWRRHAASAFLVRGDTQEARRLAEEEVALARELSGPIAQAGSMRVLATALPAADRIDVLREAASLVGGGPGLMVQGQVAADLGAALRRTGQIGDARRILTEAVDLADRCGAGSLAHRAREELLAAGGRPRRTRVTGAEALTPSEARVARLAQDGLTNTVIAQTLFVSRKTVEKHLANAYGKLGITSRAGLAGIDLG